MIYPSRESTTGNIASPSDTEWRRQPYVAEPTLVFYKVGIVVWCGAGSVLRQADTRSSLPMPPAEFSGLRSRSPCSRPCIGGPETRTRASPSHAIRLPSPGSVALDKGRPSGPNEIHPWQPGVIVAGVS